MSRPRTAQDVFTQISTSARQTRVIFSPDATYENFVRNELEKARNCYSFMQGVTEKDYFFAVVSRRAQDKQRDQDRPVLTAAEFWDAALRFDPLSRPEVETDLEKIFSDNRIDSIPLGKLKGLTKLELIPAIGALTTNQNSPGTALRYAATDAGALYYPDGHPSDLRGSSEYQSSEKTKLRRFASLGWAIHVLPDGSWYKTGHVLVIDMEAGRDRQPWFVLASEWPTDEDKIIEDNFITYAPKEVLFNDFSQPGVLPGDRNRTPVARIEPFGEAANAVPVLKQFGPDFIFVARRYGSERIYRTANRTKGPALADVMEWYWDPSNNQEVCYDKHGREYMRYDRATKELWYPNLLLLRSSTIGEEGMFGTLKVPDFVTLAARTTQFITPSPWQVITRESSAIETF